MRAKAWYMASRLWVVVWAVVMKSLMRDSRGFSYINWPRMAAGFALKLRKAILRRGRRVDRATLRWASLAENDTLRRSSRGTAIKLRFIARLRACGSGR